MKTYYTVQIDNPLREQVLQRLELLNLIWEVGKAPGIEKQGKINGLTVTYYHNGKILLQGKRVLEIIGQEVFEDNQVIPNTELPPIKYQKMIGADESGKGDYFGPLVTAAVLSHADQEAFLLELGVRDSKKLTDKQIDNLALEIMEHMTYAVQIMMPNDYNKEYQQIGNLNFLLAKLHSNNITELIKYGCDTIIIDKFAADEVMTKTLVIPDGCQLIQTERAESKFLAVAAASIIARWHFITALGQLGVQYEKILPRGAWKVEETGRDLIKNYGTDVIKQVAKHHFKTTEKIIQSKHD